MIIKSTYQTPQVFIERLGGELSLMQTSGQTETFTDSGDEYILF